MNKAQQYMLIIDKLLNTNGIAKITVISRTAKVSNSQVSDTVNELLVPNGLIKKSRGKITEITNRGRKFINDIGGAYER